MVIASGIELLVGLGEIRVTRDPEATLVCVGLGSCVALCAWDPGTRIGGMAHLFLAARSNQEGPPGKFVDTGVPALLQEMASLGASKRRLEVKVVGGARMLTVPGAQTRLKVGEENVAAVRKMLLREGLAAKAEDVGGASGRHVQLFVSTGKVIVRTVGQEARSL